MCTYCGCQELTFIGRLTAEHEQIIEATGDLRRAAVEDDASAGAEAGRALAGPLGPHTSGEELGLFTELSLVEGFADHVAALCAEHDDLDAALAGIIAGDLDRVTPFIISLRRHIDREENGLFPAAAIALEADAMQRLTDGDGSRHPA